MKKYLLALLSVWVLSPQIIFANCNENFPKLMISDIETLGSTISKNKISTVKKLDSLLYTFWEKCPQNFSPLWSRTPEDHEKYKKGVCEWEEATFNEQKKKDILALNPERDAYNKKRKYLAQLIKKNQKLVDPDLTEQNKLSQELIKLHKEFMWKLNTIQNREFTCSLDKETFINTNGVLYVPWVKEKSVYNIIMEEWGKGKVKEAFEFTFRKHYQSLQTFLVGSNIEGQKSFENITCTKYMKNSSFLTELKNKKYLFLWITPEEQLDILRCVLIKNKDSLSIRGQINTLWGKERSTNIWIWIKTLEGLWNPGETISVYNRVQSAKGYIDGLALFVDEKDKSKVTTKPVYQWGICWVSTVFYQTILGAYKDFKIETRYPHLSFYKTYYNYDWIDASLYGEKGHVYKDFKVTNVSNWPMLVLTSTNGNEKANQFSYYATVWAMYPFQKSYINYGKKYKKWASDCITNQIVNTLDNKKLDSITSCYMWGMH